MQIGPSGCEKFSNEGREGGRDGVKEEDRGWDTAGREGTEEREG